MWLVAGPSKIGSRAQVGQACARLSAFDDRHRVPAQVDRGPEQSLVLGSSGPCLASQVLHFPKLRMLWSPSQRFTADVFLKLKEPPSSALPASTFGGCPHHRTVIRQEQEPGLVEVAPGGRCPRTQSTRLLPVGRRGGARRRLGRGWDLQVVSSTSSGSTQKPEATKSSSRAGGSPANHADTCRGGPVPAGRKGCRPDRQPGPRPVPCAPPHHPPHPR